MHWILQSNFMDEPGWDVLDVCETSDGMKIVEINTINAAGFYAGDVQKIVMALESLGNRRKLLSPGVSIREYD